MNKKELTIKRSKLSDSADIWENKGKVAWHSDGWKHWMVKAAIGYVLRQKGHVFATEVEFSNGRIADVLDLNTFLVYELESNHSDKDEKEKKENFWSYEHVRDTLVIDPQSAPDDLDELRGWAEDKLVL